MRPTPSSTIFLTPRSARGCPTGPATPRPTTFITPEDFHNIAIYPTEDYMTKLQFINDLGENARLYDELWTMIKTR